MITFFIILLILFIVFTGVFVLKAQTKNKLERALKWLQTGEYENAMKLFKELAGKNPSNTLYNWYIGLCYENLRNYELALVELNKASLSTTFKPPLYEADIHERIAYINMEIGNEEKAAQEFRVVTSLNPQHEDAYYNLGIIARNRDELQKGVEYFNKAVQYKQDFPRAWLELGKLSFQLTHYDKARKSFLKAITGDPDLIEAHFYYALLLEKDRSFKKGIEEFSLALQDDRFTFDSYVHLGSIYMELSDEDRAFHFFEKALEIGTQNAQEMIEFKYKYANFLVSSGDIKKALTLWKEVQAAQEGYKDIESKLKIYGEVSRSENLTRFITASKQDFLNTGKALCEILGIKVEKYKFGKDNFIEFKGSSPLVRGEGSCIIYLARWTGRVGEMPVRELLERMSEENALKGIFITSSNFSDVALNLSMTRPLELIGKDKLEKILSKVYE